MEAVAVRVVANPYRNLVVGAFYIMVGSVWE